MRKQYAKTATGLCAGLALADCSAPPKTATTPVVDMLIRQGRVEEAVGTNIPFGKNNSEGVVYVRDVRINYIGDKCVTYDVWAAGPSSSLAARGDNHFSHNRQRCLSV